MFDILQPITEQISDCMVEICDAAAEIVRSHTPKPLHSKCAQLASIHYQMDVMAWIVEKMVKDGFLLVPDTNEKLCVYGVKR